MKRIAFVLSSILIFTLAHAASFDCTKAGTKIEHFVCDNPEISKLDDELAASYEKALQHKQNVLEIRKTQRKWIAKRDECPDASCVKCAYLARMKELDNEKLSGKETGNFRCGEKGTSFEIKDGEVADFYSSTAISDPDLANGYSVTCAMNIGDFTQIKGKSDYRLQFSSVNNQYGESHSCQVHIKNGGSKFHAYTSNCHSECMKFDFEVAKNGPNCHLER